MSRKHRLYVFADQEGFEVMAGPEVIAAEGVPCLLANGTVGYCRIEKSYDDRNGKATKSIGGAVHGVRVTLDKEAQDGRVYQARWRTDRQLLRR